ncbi:hypothetical protein VTK73DRAFT_4994 [Phialemonium thermophilum]|uniref:SDR family oxidoreductase n=1 Tax=Phialemonium thermophilum TaxID=223376 RepID=A0ABR3WR41_9PEZI
MPGLDLQDKRVIITGAGGGIGRALVAAFRGAGATVIACDRDDASLGVWPPESDGNLPGATLQPVERHAFDLAADPDTIRAAASRISPAPDVIVHNAGATTADTLSAVDDATLDWEMRLNLTGVVHLTRALLPRMIERCGAGGDCSVVFVSSVNAIQHFGNPVYAMAKAAQLAFVRGLAVEYGRHGVRANAVCPGTVATPIWEQPRAAHPDVFQQATAHYPLGRLVSPDEVANAVLFLASPLSGGISGATIPVDGGATSGNLRFINDVILPASAES